MSISFLLVRAAAALGMSIAPAFAQNAAPQPAPNVPPVVSIINAGGGNAGVGHNLPHENLSNCVSVINQVNASLPSLISISYAACVVNETTIVENGVPVVKPPVLYRLVWRNGAFHLPESARQSAAPAPR